MNQNTPVNDDYRLPVCFMPCLLIVTLVLKLGLQFVIINRDRLSNM